MDTDKIIAKLLEENITIEDPLFYSHVFNSVSQQRKLDFAREGDNFKRSCAEEYNELSQQLDITGIQESCSVRNVLRTRRLANLLINDSGDLNVLILPKLIEHIKNFLYSLGPSRQFDAKRQEHLLHVLVALNENKDLQRTLKSIDKPVSHKYAEQIIRDTLQIPQSVTLTDAHTRRAILAAWMCTLRQNVGSCFATAPAIIIHDEQPEMFFKDIRELLATGRLKRTFGGIEYSVPLSSSWGAGDLKKPFLLPLGYAYENSQIWLSPGLLEGFKEAGLIEADADFETNTQKVKALIQEALSISSEKTIVVITSEEIIKRVLLKHLGITEQDVHDFENRPRAMIHSGLLMQTTSLGQGKAKGKGELCASYLMLFAVACNAFKALADNALLKAWEFTIASFSETKSQFTRWNLYSSLGLGPQEPGGIGACIYEIIKKKLEQCNQKVQEVQYDYEQVFHQLKTMEMRMRSASSEKEAQWIKIEYQTKRNEFHTLEEMRDEVHHKAKIFANLFDMLIDQYDALFPRYFQEVYDADMHDISASQYDDSPAGFRLLYKYGRSNTSQWARIKTPNEFIENLSAFFIATETEIAAVKEFEAIQNELSEIITAIVSHVRTQEFLETAFYRMAAAHKTPMIRNPLENLDKIEKKPWAYTSGGTMSTLVSCYYRREQKPTEVSRWVENPLELLTFFVDSLKQNPQKIMEGYLQNPQKSMLMHSPTHAFLLKPGASLFKQAWQTDAFSYTWLRDRFVIPQQKFLESLWMNEQMMHYLVEHLSKIVPDDFRHYFMKVFANIYGTMTPSDFRNHLLQGIQRERGLRRPGMPILTEEQIDSVLYSWLPLFSRSELRERLEMLYGAIPSLDETFKERLLSIFDQLTPTYSQQPVMSAADLQNIAKALICLALGTTSSPIDYHRIVADAAKQLGFSLPPPIIFADTNWVKEEFGFVVNPGSGRLELWRVDALGNSGTPMTHWEEWLNGSRQDINWGIYTKSYEYSP